MVMRTAKMIGPTQTSITTTPYQYVDLPSLGTSAERAEREVLWINESGQVVGGAQAIGRWLERSPGPLKVIGKVIRIPGFRQIAGVIYRGVAKNRHRIPGGHPACPTPADGSRPAEPDSVG